MICISPEKIIATLPQLSEIGVETAFVVSGGFKETDSAGENLEKQLVEEAKKWGILPPDLTGRDWYLHPLTSARRSFLLTRLQEISQLQVNPETFFQP